MRDFAQIIRNTSLLAVARLSQPLVSALLTIAIARHLLDEGLGAYTSALTYYFVFQMVASIGLKTLLTREVAKEPGTLWRRLTSSLVLVVPAALAITAAAVLALPLYAGDDTQTRNAALVLLPAIFASALIDIIEGLLFGISRFRYYALSHTIENALRVLVAWLALLSGGGVFALALVFMLARVGQLLSCGTYFVLACGPPRWTGDGPRPRELLRQALPFIAIMAVVSLYWRLDILVLYPSCGKSEVGVYSAALRIVTVLVLSIQSFVAALYPVLAKRFKEKPDELAAFTRRAIKHVLLLAIPVCATISLLSREITIVVFRENFERSADVLALQAWLPIPYAITVIQAHALLASGRQRIDLAVNAIGTGVLAALVFLLVPRYGAMGAAWATVSSMVVYLAIQSPVAGVLHWPRRRMAKTAGVALAGITLAAAAYLAPWPSLARVALAVAGYIALLIVLRPLDRGESDILRALFSRSGQT